MDHNFVFGIFSKDCLDLSHCTSAKSKNLLFIGTKTNGKRMSEKVWVNFNLSNWMLQHGGAYGEIC